MGAKQALPVTIYQILGTKRETLLSWCHSHQLVQKCSLSAGHLIFLEGGKTSESLGYVLISPLAIEMEFPSTLKHYNSDLLSL